MTSLEKIGNEIKERRLNAGLSRDQLAKEAGCSVGTIFNIENGGNCQLEILDNIGAVLDCHVELIDGYTPEIVEGAK